MAIDKSPSVIASSVTSLGLDVTGSVYGLAPLTHVSPSVQRNVFATRLAIQRTITEMEMIAQKRGRDYEREVKGLMSLELIRAVKAEAPRCANCDRLKMTFELSEDESASHKRIAMAAVCGLDQPNMTSVICPDGLVMSRDGKARYMIEQSEEEFSGKPKSTPEFSADFTQPYIRNDPDRPQTAADETAW